MSKQKSRLSRQAIAKAALRIADAEGFGAVSMRRVAEELGVGTMSLYYYVATKDDLIAAMDDAMMTESVLPSLPKGAIPAMTAIAKQTLAVLLRHPWTLAVNISAPPGPNALRHVEQCLEALAETGLTPRQKLSLLMNIDDFVFGHARRMASAEATIDPALAEDLAASEDFPNLKEALKNGVPKPDDRRFDQGLRAILSAALPADAQ